MILVRSHLCSTQEKKATLTEQWSTRSPPRRGVFSEDCSPRRSLSTRINLEEDSSLSKVHSPRGSHATMFALYKSLSVQALLSTRLTHSGALCKASHRARSPQSGHRLGLQHSPSKLTSRFDAPTPGCLLQRSLSLRMALHEALREAHSSGGLLVRRFARKEVCSPRALVTRGSARQEIRLSKGPLVKSFAHQKVHLPRGSLTRRSAGQKVHSSGGLLTKRFAHQEVLLTKRFAHQEVSSPGGPLHRRFAH